MPGESVPAMNEPVAITGMGCVSAAGDCLAAHREGLRSATRLCAPWNPVASAYPHPAFTVSGPELVETPEEMRVARLALKAAREALEQAGMLRPPPDLRVGVFLGTTTACQFNDMEFQRRAYETEGELRTESPERYFSGQLAERVGRRLGLPDGPRWVIANACASGTDAIGMAWQAVRQGLCDMALAGGADEITLASFCGFLSLGVLSAAPCRPFDRDRSGLNLGERSGHGRSRTGLLGGSPRTDSRLFVAGYGAAADGHHMTAPHPEGLGLEDAARRALRAAGVAPRRHRVHQRAWNGHARQRPDRGARAGAVVRRTGARGFDQRLYRPCVGRRGRHGSRFSRPSA
jgi:3-oxoacyl-(acyl-carrier-protein) synthase